MVLKLCFFYVSFFKKTLELKFVFDKLIIKKNQNKK